MSTQIFVTLALFNFNAESKKATYRVKDTIKTQRSFVRWSIYDMLLLIMDVPFGILLTITPS